MKNTEKRIQDLRRELHSLRDEGNDFVMKLIDLEFELQGEGEPLCLTQEQLEDVSEVCTQLGALVWRLRVSRFKLGERRELR